MLYTPWLSLTQFPCLHFVFLLYKIRITIKKRLMQHNLPIWTLYHIKIILVNTQIMKKVNFNKLKMLNNRTHPLIAAWKVLESRLWFLFWSNHWPPDRSSLYHLCVARGFEIVSSHQNLQFLISLKWFVPKKKKKINQIF